MSKRKFSINGVNRNATRIDVSARQFKVIVDEPLQLDGTNDGPNPFEYILTGYAGSLNVVAHIVAKELGITLHKLFIEITGDINPANSEGISFEERSGFQNINVHLQVYSNANEVTLAKWHKILEERCPIHDNLSNPTPVNILVNQYVSAN
jgi:uncharacterized OsmC-like protein